MALSNYVGYRSNYFHYNRVDSLLLFLDISVQSHNNGFQVPKFPRLTGMFYVRDYHHHHGGSRLSSEYTVRDTAHHFNT